MLYAILYKVCANIVHNSLHNIYQYFSKYGADIVYNILTYCTYCTHCTRYNLLYIFANIVQY